jgi:hypothetical protein
MTDVAPRARALAAPLQPVAPMLQAVAPMLETLALSLPHSPAVLVAAPFQPLSVTLPAPPLMLDPIATPLQPLTATLEPPACMLVTSTVAGMPVVRVPLGALDGKGIGRADLRGQPGRAEAQRGGEDERRVKPCHAFLPAAGPRGSKWSEADSNGRVTTKRCGR